MVNVDVLCLVGHFLFVVVLFDKNILFVIAVVSDSLLISGPCVIDFDVATDICFFKNIWTSSCKLFIQLFYDNWYRVQKFIFIHA